MTTILIVDDSELINRMLYDTLTTLGYDVRQAHDANQAYASIEQQVPDLVLLDIQLPDVNGFDVCKIFRSHPKTKHIPIILITGTASSTAEKVKGLQSGADDYVLKPFDMDELLERVRAVLRRSEPRPVTTSTVMPAPTPHRPEAPAHFVPDSGVDSSPELQHLSARIAVWRSLVAPTSLPLNLPQVSLIFVISMITLILTGLIAAPGTEIKPVMACGVAILLWSFAISVLVVMSSLAGIGLKWREGAPLFSLAAMPLIIKLAGACVFSAWTTLSPFLYTASPLLLISKFPAWGARLDLFEVWAAVILALLLHKRPGATWSRVLLVTFTVWALLAVAAFGLLRFGGGS